MTKLQTPAERGLPFQMPWTFHLPALFRMMERQYVDLFFQTGELRLSSFREFSLHPDEERKDTEGTHVVFGQASSFTVVGVTGHGDDAYVLCGTAARPTPDLLGAFSSEGAIQIFDPLGFATEIALQIPGVKRGLSGFCDYYGGHIEAPLTDEHVSSVLEPGNPNGLNGLGAMVMQVAGTQVFFKKKPKFAHQVEYRWLWFAEGELPMTLTVYAPNARQFCRPWYPEASRAEASPPA